MLERITRDFREAIPPVDFCSLRFVETRCEEIAVRQDVVQPVTEVHDRGAMITVIDQGALGYAATSDLSRSGIEAAIARARAWADRTRASALVDFSAVPMPHPVGAYRSPVLEPWDQTSLEAKIDQVAKVGAGLKIDPRIVDWSASVESLITDSVLLTNDGGEVHQRVELITPNLSVTAHADGETQTRSLGMGGSSLQGGLEVLPNTGFFDIGDRLAAEALELLSAPNCPTDVCDLLLAPDQMTLQIHESIGHPIELDRILGDERNYAGTSFVTEDMFGTYRYGSDLLNVSFDPSRTEQYASYGFDDDGVVADKTLVIENGILMRPLGSIVSGTRAEIEPLGNSRATNWNRPPIDRMANLNVEPGDSTFDELVAGIEHGVMMETNLSWSIDDSRNKFQFGCEVGRMIENGELTHLVKNPNYRGISATFWRSLAGVGDESTFEVLAVANCGKGEPNQAVRVGHASPACRFTDVEVFGGE